MAGEEPLRLSVFGESVLHTPTTPVKSVDDDVMRTASRMLRVMRAAGGVGISAPQIGSSLRMSLISALMPSLSPDVIMPDVNGESVLLINPVLEWHGDHQVLLSEGCLSTGNQHWTQGMRRWYRVRVRYQDAALREQTWTAVGSVARILQHELDHLDGKMITDNVTRNQRRQVERIIAKAFPR